jgi:catechol 2,3-dioxygenase-like lactoylglutathione lyase family enzyme
MSDAAHAPSETQPVPPPPFAIPGRMAIVTIGAPDLGAARDAYAHCFGFRVIQDGRVSSAEAAAWGAPAQAGSPFIVMGPDRPHGSVFRFVEIPKPTSPLAPFTTYGWAAAEIAVADVEAIHAELPGSPFATVNPPSNLQFTSPIRPMQAAGPSGEGLYLNEILGASPRYHLPKAEAKVDQVFIMILATRDRAAAVSFYEKTIGLEKSADYTIQYNTLNKAFGLPPDTKHSFSMTKLGPIPAVQIDELPPQAVVRPHAAGSLPGGIAMVSFLVDAAHFEAAAGAVYPAPSFLQGMHEAKSTNGPAGERIELIALPRTGGEEP